MGRDAPLIDRRVWPLCTVRLLNKCKPMHPGRPMHPGSITNISWTWMQDHVKARHLIACLHNTMCDPASQFFCNPCLCFMFQNIVLGNFRVFIFIAQSFLCDTLGAAQSLQIVRFHLHTKVNLYKPAFGKGTQGCLELGLFRSFIFFCPCLTNQGTGDGLHQWCVWCEEYDQYEASWGLFLGIV